MKAVAETKKMFEDSFGVGNIPPHVTFVALDFDRSVIDDRSLATDISADFVQLPLSVNPFMICHSQMQSGKYESISLLTGPEGGLEEREVEQAKEAGLQICTLGKRILRCETAPLCALSAVMYASGEF